MFHGVVHTVHVSTLVAAGTQKLNELVMYTTNQGRPLVTIIRAPRVVVYCTVPLVCTCGTILQVYPLGNVM